MKKKILFALVLISSTLIPQIASARVYFNVFFMEPAFVPVEEYVVVERYVRPCRCRSCPEYYPPPPYYYDDYYWDCY